MANNVIGSLIVNLGLETARLKSDTDKAARHFNGFEKKAQRSLKSVGRGVSSLMTSMGALTGVAGVLSVAGFGALIKSSIDTADNIGKLSDRLGASTEALSEYKHVADLSGVSFNTLTMGWQRMTRRVAEAAQGTGEAKNALIELNLSAQDLNRLKPEQQFEVLADALNGVENQADKVRLSMKLFDSEGVSLLQTMTKGADGIREYRDQAKAMGRSLSIDQVDAAVRAKDAMALFSGTVDGLAIQLTDQFIPAITRTIKLLSFGIPAAVEFAQPAFEGIGKDIFNLWEALNPSGITGTTTLEEALRTQSILSRQLSRAQKFGTAEQVRNLRQELDAQNLLIDAIKRRQSILSAKKPLTVDITGGGSGPPPVVAPAAEPPDPGQDREKERLSAQLDTLTVSLMTEEERLFNSYANRQLIVEDAFETGLINQQRHQELLLQLESDFETQRTAIVQKGYSDREKFAAMSSKAQTKHVIGQAIALTQGVTGESRKLFEINKVAGIANAVINTYEGVTKTMAAYPYPLNVAMAGLSLAAGLAQVSAIKSTSFGGGGGAPSLAATGGTPSNPVPQTSETGPAAVAGGIQEIKITIDGTGVLARDQAEEIARSLREYIADGGESFAA